MKKFVWFTIASIFSVLFSCWIPIKDTVLWYPQFLALITVFFFGLSLVLWKFDKAISLFTFVCLASCVKFGYQPKALFMLMQIYFSCLAMYGISKFNRQERRMILWGVFVVVILQSAYVIIQKLGMDPLFDYTFQGVTYKGVDDTVGFSGSHNMLGLFFAVTGPVVIYLFPYILPLVLFGLFCATSSFAWTGFTVSTIVTGLRMDRRVLIGIIASLIIGSGIFFYKFEDFSLGNFSGRYHPCKTAIESVVRGNIPLLVAEDKESKTYEIIRCNPLFGYGLANFSSIFPYYESKYFNTTVNKYVHLHNDIGEAFFELGLLFLVPLFLFLIGLIRMISKYRFCLEAITYSSCIFSYLICTLGIFGSHTAIGGVWFILFYGMLKGATNGT